jgi:hypothetical protein
MRKSYPNLYHSMNESYFRETLEDVYRYSEKSMNQKKYKETFLLNRNKRVVKIQKYSVTKCMALN